MYKITTCLNKDVSCSSADELEAIVSDLLSSALVIDVTKPSIHQASVQPKSADGIFANANSFWLIPVLSIIGTVAINTFIKK